MPVESDRPGWRLLWPVALVVLALALHLVGFVSGFWVDNGRFLVSFNSVGGLLGAMGLAGVFVLGAARSRAWIPLLVLAGLAAVSFDIVAAVKMGTESGAHRLGDTFTWEGEAGVLSGVAVVFGLIAEPIGRSSAYPLVAALIASGVALGAIGLSASALDIQMWFGLAGIPVALASAVAATHWRKASPIAGGGVPG